MSGLLTHSSDLTFFGSDAAEVIKTRRDWEDLHFLGACSFLRVTISAEDWPRVVTAVMPCTTHQTPLSFLIVTAKRSRDSTLLPSTM